MTGLSTSTSISFGCALVAGRNRVPRPAAGKTALRIVPAIRVILPRLRPRWGTRARFGEAGAVVRCGHDARPMIDPALLRDNLEAVRTGLQNRGVEMTSELEDLAAL